jgi:hypothetical protein
MNLNKNMKTFQTAYDYIIHTHEYHITSTEKKMVKQIIDNVSTNKDKYKDWKTVVFKIGNNSWYYTGENNKISIQRKYKEDGIMRECTFHIIPKI